MSDITAMGELLIDFTYTEADGETLYKRNAGGAPANVACMAAKLGASASFIGKIGKDIFGNYLKDVLIQHNVDTRGLMLDPRFLTSLAFIKNIEDGERSFIFYRRDTLSADINIQYSEIDLKLIDECRIFHFGALSLTDEPSRSAALNAVEYAKSKGKLISFDPNWRPLLWSDEKAAVRVIRSAAQYADILKVSEDELRLITDCDTLIASAAKLLRSGVKIICITQGAKGCIIATSKDINRYPSYKVRSVDTLGSGDSFLGAFLYKLIELDKPVDELDSNDISEAALFSNACGALCSTKHGAIPAMPSKEEILELMKNAPAKDL